MTREDAAAAGRLCLAFSTVSSPPWLGSPFASGDPRISRSPSCANLAGNLIEELGPAATDDSDEATELRNQLLGRLHHVERAEGDLHDATIGVGVTATWVIRWPDGSTTEGSSATELIDLTAAEQWSPTDHDGMKRLLSDRCWALGRVFELDRGDIDPLLPDDEFLKALAAAGCFDLDIKEE